MRNSEVNPDISSALSLIPSSQGFRHTRYLLENSTDFAAEVEIHIYNNCRYHRVNN